MAASMEGVIGSEITVTERKSGQGPSGVIRMCS